jgi:hypothetical protein
VADGKHINPTQPSLPNNQIVELTFSFFHIESKQNIFWFILIGIFGPTTFLMESLAGVTGHQAKVYNIGPRDIFF